MAASQKTRVKTGSRQDKDYYPELMPVSKECDLNGCGQPLDQMELVGFMPPLETPSIHIQASGKRIARLTKDAVIYDVIAAYPQTVGVLARHGYTPLKNARTKLALAGTITLEQTSRIHGINLETLLEDLNKAIEKASDG